MNNKKKTKLEPRREEELPTADQAREQALEYAIKRLDGYVQAAIKNGETERHFDFAGWHDGDQLLIDHIAEVAQHFRDKNYRVSYRRADDDVLRDVEYDDSHPWKRFFLRRYTVTESIKGYTMLVKW